MPPDGIINCAPWPGNIADLSKDQIEQTIEAYINSYANTNVKAILFNVNYQRVCYDSKVWDTYWDVSKS
ncbi:MAG: hypothetical protein HC905_05275 [Bacteroidales bacterium]|nr:hypothetical protein [Bacteroidales bacterium]